MTIASISVKVDGSFLSSVEESHRPLGEALERGEKLSHLSVRNVLPSCSNSCCESPLAGETRFSAYGRPRFRIERDVLQRPEMSAVPVKTTATRAKSVSRSGK